MVIKPSELEQKVAEQKKKKFDEQVVALETKIDEHLVFSADRTNTLGSISYSVVTRPTMYGTEAVPEAVVLKVIAKYEAAGWNVQQAKHGYNATILLFAPKDLPR